MSLNKPFVSVIVLNLNREKFLEDCLDSIANQTYSNLEIIFVDNGSGDNSVEFVRKNFPQVKILENKKNLGFAEGNNRGVEIAKGEYIFIINNDTKVEKNCLKNLVDIIDKDKKIGMLAPKILSFENPQLIDSVGLNIYFDGIARGRGRNEIDKGQYNRVEEILLPSGCAALYRKRMLDEIGLFDKIFFAYCEDTDLGLRGRLAGWKAISVPSAIIYHHYSGTTGKYSDFKLFLVERNHFWVALKNFPPKLLFLLPIYTLKRYFFFIIGTLFKKGPISKFQSKKSRLIIIVFKAYISALSKTPKMLIERKKIKRKISNREFYSLLKKYYLPVSKITLED